jgi:hypothetical protein
VSDQPQSVWLVTAEAVYDHGVWYVGRSLEDAEQYAKDYAPDNDGHHEWRIDEMVLGVPLLPSEPAYRMGVRPRLREVNS